MPQADGLTSADKWICNAPCGVVEIIVGQCVGACGHMAIGYDGQMMDRGDQVRFRHARALCSQAIKIC